MITHTITGIYGPFVFAELRPENWVESLMAMDRKMRETRMHDAFVKISHTDDGVGIGALEIEYVHQNPRFTEIAQDLMNICTHHPERIVEVTMHHYMRPSDHNFGDFEVIGYRLLEEDNESNTFEYRIKVPEDIDDTIKAVNAAVCDELNTHCTHDYDCCGHWYTNVWTHKTKKEAPRQYRITVNSSMNV